MSLGVVLASVLVELVRYLFRMSVAPAENPGVYFMKPEVAPTFIIASRGIEVGYAIGLACLFAEAGI